MSSKQGIDTIRVLRAMVSYLEKRDKESAELSEIKKMLYLEETAEQDKKLKERGEKLVLDIKRARQSLLEKDIEDLTAIDDRLLHLVLDLKWDNCVRPIKK